MAAAGSLVVGEKFVARVEQLAKTLLFVVVHFPSASCASSYGYIAAVAICGCNGRASDAVADR